MPLYTPPDTLTFSALHYDAFNVHEAKGQGEVMPVCPFFGTIRTPPEWPNERASKQVF
jgi:hypothetical protein